MLDAAVRWFASALIVSVVSLTLVTYWNAGFSLQETILYPAIYAFYSSLFILPACVIAVGLNAVGRRVLRRRDWHFWVFAVVVGSLSGVAVTIVWLPPFVSVAVVAGGTGGAVSASTSPFLSRPVAITLVIGVLLSTGIIAVLQ